MKLNQRGFALVELAVALGIMAMLGIPTLLVTYHVLKGTDYNCNHVTALRQTQNAGHWISRDAKMAQNVSADNLTLPQFLHLGWTDNSSGNEYQIIYTLEDMAEGGLKKLLRNESINGGPDSKTLVALNIDSDPQKSGCQFDNGILTLTITSTAGGGSLTQSATRVYKVLPRAN